MIKELTIDASSGRQRIYISEIEKCPLCKYSLIPELIYEYLPPYERDAIFLYRCPKCHDFFIAVYSDVLQSCGTFPSRILKLAPQNFVPATCNEYVSEISPQFVKIYNQALAAENSNLDEIAGIGYRRALEFLIKDFLISENQDDTETIKALPLGKCINNKIDNHQLKIAASRAAWLGNDQAHYVQKFEDKDISDLKHIINIACHWIALIMETREIEQIQPQ